MPEPADECLLRAATDLLHELSPEAERQLSTLVRQPAGTKVPLLPAIILQLRDLGRTAGKASGRKIIINCQLVDHPDSLRPTMAHELAHIVVEQARQRLRVRRRKGPWSAHGSLWRGVALALGDNGDRCHELELKPSRTVSRYIYRLPDGTERHLSAIRHHRLQRNRQGSYQWSGDSEAVRWHHLVGKVKG